MYIYIYIIFYMHTYMNPHMICCPLLQPGLTGCFLSLKTTSEARAASPAEAATFSPSNSQAIPQNIIIELIFTKNRW